MSGGWGLGCRLGGCWGWPSGDRAPGSGPLKVFPLSSPGGGGYGGAEGMLYIYSVGRVEPLVGRIWRDGGHSHKTPEGGAGDR